MRKNPTIEELQNSGDYELIARVKHAHIKEFVLRQVMQDKKFIPPYMVYQTLLFLGSVFFLTRAIVLAIRGNADFLIVTVVAIVFSMTLLVVIHELLHGVVLWMTKAPRVSFGRVKGRFIFYAAAHHHVLGRKAFNLVAFTPLVVVQIVTLAGIFIWYPQPMVFFPLMVMCIHSFFCAGDIALATLFHKYPGHEVFTYDDQDQKASLYYVSKQKVSSTLN
jgi:hypothetical protein